MDTDSAASSKPSTRIEILYWSPSGIILDDIDKEMIKEAVRLYRHENRPARLCGDTQENDREYSINVTTVAFDLICSGDEIQDHAENFINIAKMCSHVGDKDDGSVLYIVCLREPFPVEAMSALHDVYVCSGSPIKLVLKDKDNKVPENCMVGVNCVMMPVVGKDGSVLRWTSIY